VKPGWSAMEAIQKRKIAVVSDAINRPGPRIVDAVEEFVAANSPGSFCGEELMQPLTLSKVAVRCGILALVLFVVVVIALKFGAVPISLYGLAKDLIGVLIGHSSNISSEYGMIIREIRLPRIALGIFVGASLSVEGTSFQAVLRNPLADPYVLGVSFGAAVGIGIGFDH